MTTTGGPAVIFELGINHLGSVDRALRMLDALAAAGAGFATLQVVVDPSRSSRNPAAVAAARKNCLTLEQNMSVITHGASLGLRMGAVVLDLELIAPVMQAGAGFFKVLSSDISHEPLLAALAATARPLYLSTGAATTEDIARALAIVRQGSSPVSLIHTVLQVPTPPARLDLRNIPALAAAFGVPVAYGQHSDDPQAVYTAVALGAVALFIYVAEERDPALPDGPNAILCPAAADTLRNVDLVHTMMGSTERRLSADDARLQRIVRRSIVAARSIAAGKKVTAGDVTFKRPGTGVEPWDLSRVTGSVADRDYEPGEDLPGRPALDTIEGDGRR
jgi:N,N'-diacetyllegionaminate synthase